MPSRKHYLSLGFISLINAGERRKKLLLLYLNRLENLSLKVLLFCRCEYFLIDFVKSLLFEKFIGAESARVDTEK